MTDESGSGERDDVPSGEESPPSDDATRAAPQSNGPVSRPAGRPDSTALTDVRSPEAVSTSEASENGDGDGDEISRCDYCRLPIPATSIHVEREEVTYRFCSAACRDALADQEQVFTEYHGHRRLSTGISVLDAALPQGIPRNSFVLISELAGSRIEAVQAELAWRALQRGEPVVYVTFLEPPVSVVQEFVDMEWNVLPSLERGDLQILDCFSYRVEDRDRMYERLNAWNRHLWDVAREATTTVRDPSDTIELQNRIDGVLEDGSVHDRGVVIVDSLVEFGSQVQPVQAYNFVKDVRADVCKGRFVPIFAGATVTQDGEGFPHDLDYMVDGLVDLNLDGELVEDALVKRMRVRKMNGVLTYPEWQVYEYSPGAGAVAFDPLAEQAAQEAGGDGTQRQPGGGSGGTDDRGGGQGRPDQRRSAGNRSDQDRPATDQSGPGGPPTDGGSSDPPDGGPPDDGGQNG